MPVHVHNSEQTITQKRYKLREFMGKKEIFILNLKDLDQEKEKERTHLRKSEY
jgi:hypothetical protein